MSTRDQQKIISPLKYLKSAVNQVVLVKIKDGTEFIGVLEMADHTMNLVLTDCEAIDSNGNKIAKYGKVLIRGSHIVYVSVNYGQVAPEIIH